MALTKASFRPGSEQRNQGVSHTSGGPGAGSTKAKGNSASLPAHPAGNEAGTGRNGVTAPTPPGGTILKGGRGGK